MGMVDMQLAMKSIKKGINSFQLKVIAMIFMTVDHVGLYRTFFSNPDIHAFDYNSVLRVIGRVAAPLFLFLLVESLRHTRSKWKFILRLYIASVAIQIGNAIFMRYVADGYFETLGNILQTFTYTALYITCIEWLINEIRSRRILKCLLPSVLMVIPIVIAWLYMFSVESSKYNLFNFIRTFAPSPFVVEFSLVFVLLGIAWYFINNKIYNCILFAILCAVCFVVPHAVFFNVPVGIFRPLFFNVYQLFASTQWCMLLALPFMLLYNGQKGKSCKYLFYAYYPLHQYLLFALQIYVINSKYV